jgi:hypothetical protein
LNWSKKSANQFAETAEGAVKKGNENWAKIRE